MGITNAMPFSPEEYAKCTAEQKATFQELRKKKATNASTTVSVNTTAVQPATTTPTAHTSPAPTPHTIITTTTDVRHLLSNNT
jgi:hypothetical protein